MDTIIYKHVIFLHVSGFFGHPQGRFLDTSLRMAEIVNVFDCMLIQNVGLLIQKFVHSVHKVNFYVFCMDIITNSCYVPILN